MALHALAFLVICLSAPWAVQGGSISPVQKVLQMIDDFAGKVKHDIETSGKQFEKDAQYCDDEAIAKDYAIKDTKEDIDNHEATIEDQQAKIIQGESRIQDASSRISAAEGELYKTEQQREKDHKEFLAKEKELTQTMGELDGAENELKKQFAFAQTASKDKTTIAQISPQAQKRFDMKVGALSRVVEASFVSDGQREKVQAFLQAREEAEDELKVANPGMADAILETVGQLDDKAGGTLADVRNKEMESKHEFLMIKQGIENQIKSTNEELNEATHNKAASTQALAQAEKELGIAKRALSEDETYLADLKIDCQDKARVWEAEEKDGNEEMKALAKAKGVLTQKFSLVSVGATLSVKTLSHYSDDDDYQHKEDSRTHALQKIEALGRKFRSTALVSLAYSAASDPFGKVRDMIEDMIAKLQQQAAEEATQKAFCDEETAKSKKSKADKTGKLEKTTARIEKAEAAIAKLGEQIQTLSKEVLEIDTSVKEATELRTGENAAFKVAEKDFSESQEACASAIEILREYYEGAGASLAQMGAVSSSRSSLTRDAGGIIGLLEVAESDFAKLLADARTTEEASAEEFTKMMQDNKLSKATKVMEGKGKESETKSLQVGLADYSQDSESLNDELDAVNQYLGELKPQCETKQPSYAEKKAKREQEIDGLKDALETLSQSA